MTAATMTECSPDELVEIEGGNPVLVIGAALILGAMAFGAGLAVAAVIDELCF